MTMRPNIKNREDYVREFRKAADMPYFNPDSPNEDDTDLILVCISEEKNEFFDAVMQYEEYPHSEKARANLLKEWADLQYVLSQAADFFNIPSDEAFMRVANNNMTKVADDGKVRRREDGKILKPEGYQPADMRGL